MLRAARVCGLAVAAALLLLSAFAFSGPEPVAASCACAVSGAGLAPSFLNDWTTFNNTANTFFVSTAEYAAVTMGKSSKAAPQAAGSSPGGAYKRYSKEAMALAEQAAPIIGANEAARRHDVPPSTLKDHVKQPTEIQPADADEREHGLQMLSDAGMEALNKWVLAMQRRGQTPTQQEICAQALKICEKNPPQNSRGQRLLEAWRAAGRAGKKFFRAFKARFPNIRKKAPNMVESSRAKVTSASLQTLPKEVKALMEKYPHLSDAKFWFNADEAPHSAATGRQPPVYGHAGEKADRETVDGSKESMTIFPCACAAGTHLPPLFIARGKGGGAPDWWGQLAPELANTSLAEAVCCKQVRNLQLQL